MGLKAALLEAVKWVLVTVVLGGGIVVGSGQAEPFLSPSDIPGGPGATFAGMIVGVVVVIYGIDHLQAGVKGDEWEAAGRHAGLQPDGDGGIWSLPDLTGTIDGRAVRARIQKHRIDSSNDNSPEIGFTVVEAELDGPAADGLVAGIDGGTIEAPIGTLEFEDMVENVSVAEELTAVEAGDLVVVGTSEAAARAITDGSAGEAVRSLEKLNLVYVGDASGVVASFTEARNEEIEEAGGSIFEYHVDNLVERVPADAATVTVETQGTIRNADELRRHVVAALAVADAFEEATARAPASG